MANEAEKAFRSLGPLCDAAQEILKLRDALRIIGNSDAEVAKMAAERKGHQDIIADLKKEQDGIRAETDKKKKDSDAEVDQYRALNESKKAQLASQLAPAQNSLAQVESRLAAARAELNQTAIEVRQTKAEKEEEQRYLDKLRASIAELQKQHGIRA